MPAAAPRAAAGRGRGQGRGRAGFARTMLFAGGQAEVANLVARAIASRTGSPAGGVPVIGAAGSSGDRAAVTPVVQPVITPGARRPRRRAPAPAPTIAGRPPSAPEQLPTTVPLPILNVTGGGTEARSSGKGQDGRDQRPRWRLTPPPVTPYPPGGASAPEPRRAVGAGRGRGGAAPHGVGAPAGPCGGRSRQGGPPAGGAGGAGGGAAQVVPAGRRRAAGGPAAARARPSARPCGSRRATSST